MSTLKVVCVWIVGVQVFSVASAVLGFFLSQYVHERAHMAMLSEQVEAYLASLPEQEGL